MFMPYKVRYSLCFYFLFFICLFAFGAIDPHFVFYYNISHFILRQRTEYNDTTTIKCHRMQLIAMIVKCARCSALETRRRRNKQKREKTESLKKYNNKIKKFKNKNKNCLRKEKKEEKTNNKNTKHRYGTK